MLGTSLAILGITNPTGSHPRTSPQEVNFLPRGFATSGFYHAKAELQRGEGGEGGIRTHETLADLPLFESGTSTNSVTSPMRNLSCMLGFQT